MSSKRKVNRELKTKQDLPKGWIAKESNKYPGKIYYINLETKRSTWDLPVALNKDVSSLILIFLF